MKYIGEVFQDRRRDYLDMRNEYYKLSNDSCDLVMIGDSITEGFNLNFAGITNKKVINSGISGDRLKNIEHRIDQDVVNLNPKQVLLMAGINDLLSDTPFTIDNYENEVNKLFCFYKDNIEYLITKQITPICCGIIKISKYEHNYTFKNVQIELFNSLVEQLAKNLDLCYIDYNKVLEDKYETINDTYFSDGLHPNEKGYFEMFKLLKENKIL